MARIRTIKPDFWTAEQVMECSPIARLVFIGMWNFCDDGGNHPASVKTLKAEIFPADDITVAQVEDMVQELTDNGLLVEYEVAGKLYWHVTGWHHQKIDQPTYKHPMPDGTIPAGAPKRRAKTEQENTGACAERSPNTSRTHDECSPPERRGEERNGVNPSLSAPLPPTTRKGLVCGLLRKAGMADAAPHYLTDETWETILSKRTDEEIVEVARAKMAAKPNERIGLKYIAKALLEDPQPITANARASPNGKPPNLTDIRRNTVAALTGNTRNETTERDITGESYRVS